MEVRQSLKGPAVNPALTQTRAALKAPSSTEPGAGFESHESVACRVLFRRVPELLARLLSSSSQSGQVTLVFRLGYFDLAGLSQARKEFYQETQAGLRIMVEVPDAQPGTSNDQPRRRSVQLKVTGANLKQLARRAAALVHTERQIKTARTEAVPGPERQLRQEQSVGLETPLLRNLSLVLRADQERKPGQVTQPVSNRKPAERKLKPKKPVRTWPGPSWLRRRQLVLLQQRQIGPGFAQNAHSAERQPYCLCPGCGREMVSTLLYCPECTLRAGRSIQIPAGKGSGLVQLLLQAVCR